MGDSYLDSDVIEVFRPSYRELSNEENARIETIKERAASLLWEMEAALPPSRELSLATTHLEEAVMWAVKGATK